MEFSEENAIGDITAFAAVALAEQAEGLNLRPLRPLPNFELEDAGNSPLLAREAPHFHRVYTDSTFSPLPSRFGVRAEEDRVILDRSLAGVLEGVVRREILSLFVPAKFLTDLTYELINWDSYYEMGSPESWGQMVKGAAKTYTTEHSFSPTSFNALLRYDKTEFQAFFRRFLRKLVSLSTIVPEDAAGDTVIFLAAALGIQHVAPEYTPDDVAFAKLFFEYLTRERRHPDFTRLKVAGSPFPDETLRALVDRVDTLPFSPSCFYNPAAIGATQCFILFEVPPTASPYAIRQLTFLPNFSQGLSQLLGCPQATYLGIYLFPNQNLAEFRQHLNALKKRGVLLDYHVFRIKAGYELINLNNTLAVPPKSRATPPTLLEVASDYQEDLAPGHGMAEKWKTSWVVQQLLPLFMLRSTTLGTVTNLDHARNMESFCGMLIGTAARFRPLAREGMALLLPLLEKYRSVLYVIHLADVARILAKYCAERHLQTAGEINQVLSESTEGVASTWAQFPEKNWLGHTYEEMAAGDAGGTAFCSALGGARNALEMFSPYCIPAGQEVFDFLSAAHGQIWEVVRADVASVPQGPRVMRKYFEQLYDEILQSRLIIPRASLTILPRENVDEFVFVASRCRPFPQVCERMRQELTPHVAVSYVVRCADES
ncbi:MAG TPA: hypothetical protein VKK79_21990, partial [Candidatus Lokiarchaeia archaeon]|nr:hypothetical protein [Candidatus Lokiarchaeia archaeon]